MFEAQYSFGPATRLQAQALGQPGQRTFRLLVENLDGRSACLWLEKEQLQALGLAVEQLIAEAPGRLASASKPGPQPAAESFPPNPTIEFNVGRLALGQDESELEQGPRFVLLAYDAESAWAEDQEEPPRLATFSCRATRDQLRAVSRSIADVVAAGRPRCPLCGEPLENVTQVHGCVRTNGHHA